MLDGSVLANVRVCAGKINVSAEEDLSNDLEGDFAIHLLKVYDVTVPPIPSMLSGRSEDQRNVLRRLVELDRSSVRITRVLPFLGRSLAITAIRNHSSIRQARKVVESVKRRWDVLEHLLKRFMRSNVE